MHGKRPGQLPFRPKIRLEQFGLNLGDQRAGLDDQSELVIAAETEGIEVRGAEISPATVDGRGLDVRHVWIEIDANPRPKHPVGCHAIGVVDQRGGRLNRRDDADVNTAPSRLGEFVKQAAVREREILHVDMATGPIHCGVEGPFNLRLRRFRQDKPAIGVTWRGFRACKDA